MKNLLLLSAIASFLALASCGTPQTTEQYQASERVFEEQSDLFDD